MKSLYFLVFAVFCVLAFKLYSSSKHKEVQEELARMESQEEGVQKKLLDDSSGTKHFASAQGTAVHEVPAGQVAREQLLKQKFEDLKRQRFLASKDDKNKAVKTKKPKGLKAEKLEALKNKLPKDNVTAAIVSILGPDGKRFCMKVNDGCPVPTRDFYKESLNRISVAEFPEARTLVLNKMMVAQLPKEYKAEALTQSMVTPELQQLEPAKATVFLGVAGAELLALSPNFDYAYSVFSNSLGMVGSSQALNIVMKSMLIQKYPEQRAFIEQNFHR